MLNWIVTEFNNTFIVNDRYKLFITGFKNTIIIALGAVIIGVIIGVLVAIVRVYHSQTGKLKILNKICGMYLAVFRGTPVIVQLMIMYFIVFKSIDNAIFTAILSFGINSGAYVSEIVRAGITAVNIGQTEAGRSLGLPASKTMSLIVLPQAIRNILPALGNEFVQLLKETSVAGSITVLELTQAGASVRAQTLEPFFSLISVALIYFILVAGITKLISIAERRLSKGVRSQKSE